jgi:hypothetical protein
LIAVAQWDLALYRHLVTPAAAVDKLDRLDNLDRLDEGTLLPLLPLSALLPLFHQPYGPDFISVMTF